MAEDRRGQRPERGNGNGQGRSGSGRPSSGGGRSGGPSRGGASRGGQGGSRPSYSRDGDERRSSGPRRDGDQRRSGGPSRGGQGGSRPSYSRDGDERRSSGPRREGDKGGYRSGGPSRGGDERRSSGPRREGDKGGYRSSGPRRDGDKGGFRSGGPRREGGRDSSRDWKREEQVERTAEQARYDGPEIPAEITGKELDRNIAAQLKGLPEKLASRVARHLVAAGELIDSDPETAYQHTLAARARAGRLAVVREATGEAAYAAGHYAEALSELRAAKRMNGVPDYLPIMADCHRALKQPEQALKLAKSPSVKNFAPEAKAEMTIVEAGARSDMGQIDAALRTLELAPLMHKSRASWVVRLRYAYADTLLLAGRDEEALAWFHRTYAIDSDEITDAADRADQLERKQRN